MQRLVVITGCSGGGKSTLLEELARRGYATVAEPGRRIVQEEIVRGGNALPWADPEAFLRRVLTLTLEDHKRATRSAESVVFFDRSAIDAASALAALTGEDALTRLRDAQRYNARVFLAPPWPALFRNDGERRHSFDDAVAEYERLRHDYPQLGYETVLLPQTAIASRADFIVSKLAH